MIKKEIEDTLNKLPFVKWDRYTQIDTNKFSLFGWIEREKDTYKDFVLLEIKVRPSFTQIEATTSSEKYSEEIIEKKFKRVKNVVKL